MKSKLTRKQLINIELANRARNQRTKEVLKEHVPVEEQPGAMIAFDCECANPDCTERIEMTLQTYDKLHKNKARFVIAEGHQEPKVEKTVADKGDFTVVEKFALES